MIKTFIKDLPSIEKLDSVFVEALDNHFFDYVRMHVSYYEEMKRKGAEVFECQNRTTMGKDWAECYEIEGHLYRFDEKTCFGKCLSLDGGACYEDLNWRSLFGPNSLNIMEPLPRTGKRKIPTSFIGICTGIIRKSRNTISSKIK